MKTVFIILGIITLLFLSLLVLTVVVYWLFLDSKIKNKQAILSFLEPKYQIVFWTILYCTFVNLVLVFILEFATTIEMPGLILQYQFIAYCVFLPIPRMLIFCLKISIQKEEKGEKIKFFEALQLFWTISKKKKTLQKD